MFKSLYRSLLLQLVIFFVLSEAQIKNLAKSMKGTAPTTYEHVFVKLHKGDPGTAGTAEEATETLRKEVTLTGEGTAASPLKNSAAVEWTAVSTTETYKWVSIWSAVTAGTFLGRSIIEVEKAVTAGDNAKLPAEGFAFKIE